MSNNFFHVDELVQSGSFLTFPRIFNLENSIPISYFYTTKRVEKINCG